MLISKKKNCKSNLNLYFGNLYFSIEFKILSIYKCIKLLFDIYEVWMIRLTFDRNIAQVFYHDIYYLSICPEGTIELDPYHHTLNLLALLHFDGKVHKLHVPIFLHYLCKFNLWYFSSFKLERKYFIVTKWKKFVYFMLIVLHKWIEIMLNKMHF